MIQTLKGLVLRENLAYDNAKYINILTAERGRLSVRVRGSTKARSYLTAPTQLFSYSEFVIYEGNGRFALNDANLIENYFFLCRDYTILTLGTYVLNAVEYITNEDQPDSGILRLALNTLWALSHKPDIDPRLIKGTFELRLAALAGFAPNLVGCSGCNKPVGGERMYLNVMEGCLLCQGCMEKKQRNIYVENDIKVDELRRAQIILPLAPATILAMQYAIYAEMSRLYSFTLADELLPEFTNAAEVYLENHIEHRFPVLDMLEF